MKTFCTEPYKQIHFDSRGNLGPCCQYIGTRPDVNSFDDYLNSDWLNNLKKQLESGERISGCQFCWKQEDSGAKSMRQKRNAYYEHKPLDNVEHIMITFGNQCNTACRICNASRSSLIDKQYKESISSVTDPELMQLITKKHDWTKTKTWYRNVVNGIIDRSDSIRKLEISGGEPFINVHFDRLIDGLLNSGKKLPQINITTNGSYTDEQIKKLQNFKHCHINFSIDGVGDQFYNYLRWPLKWDDVLTKIDILKKYDWLSCEFVVVPHNLNLLNLIDTIEFLKVNTNFDPRFKIGFSWLNGAPWYSLDNSPKWARESVSKKLLELMAKYHTLFTVEENSQLLELLHILDLSNNPTNLNMLEFHTKMTDKYRNTNTWEVVGWNIGEI